MSNWRPTAKGAAVRTSILILALLAAVMTFSGGYRIGKHAADRWYAEHLSGITPTDFADKIAIGDETLCTRLAHVVGFDSARKLDPAVSTQGYETDITAFLLPNNEAIVCQHYGEIK